MFTRVTTQSRLTSSRMQAMIRTAPSLWAVPAATNPV